MNIVKVHSLIAVVLKKRVGSGPALAGEGIRQEDADIQFFKRRKFGRGVNK
jgi:hypothetical protein